VVVITGLKINPAAFAAASSRPTRRGAAKRRTGATVTYTLSRAATVVFTVVRLLPGRRSASGQCVKQSRRNRHARGCLKVVPLSGELPVVGTAGHNSFRFTGRQDGRTLAPGRYELVASPIASGLAVRSVHVRFRIVVKRVSAR
jgi:hypothetical protein